jgi:uncharacterized protein (TIGR00369 family)
MPKPASESAAILQHIIRAEDLNMHGSLFGGKMVALMDTTAAIAAMRHARRNCVTAHISDVSFLAPVRLGHILTLTARVHFTARTSMEIVVNAQREDAITGDKKTVCRAFLTFVAIDSENQPVEVPEVILETDEDRRGNAEAKQRYEMRKTARESGRVKQVLG